MKRKLIDDEALNDLFFEAMKPLIDGSDTEAFWIRPPDISDDELRKFGCAILSNMKKNGAKNGN